MKLIKGGKKEPVVEKDHSNHWRIVVPNPDHPPLKPGEELTSHILYPPF